jgi:cytoskeleton protein RodZ
VELVDLSRIEVPAEWRLRFSDTAVNLGPYLRQCRLQRHITLEAVALRTKIKPEFFDNLERNNLSKWPTSPFYRESYLRAYASAVGLDPQDVVDRYRAEFEAIKAVDTPPPVVTSVVTAKGTIPPAAIPVIIAITFVIAFSLGRMYAPARVSIEATDTNPVVSVPAAPSVTPEPEAPAAAPAAETSTVPTVTAQEIEGELVITSTPSGAHVTVNGIGRGPTPVRVQYLPVGTYTIRIVHDGHSAVTRHVTISPERHRARVAVTFDAPRTTN